MKTLLILRHAKSSWDNLDLSDYDRPLNKRGKRDAPRMGDFLRQQDLVPDLIISSTAKRAKKTAKLFAKAVGYKEKISLENVFYHAKPETYITVLKEICHDYERIMVIGHNPGLETLVAILTGRMELMPTAAVAHVLLPIDRWDQLTGEMEGKLQNLWRPKEIT